MKTKVEIKDLKSIKIGKEELEKKIVELAKEGYTSALIGLILKEKYGIRNVRKILNKKISQVMKEHNVYPEVPEDLICLMKRAIKVREHLKKHKKDKHSRRGLELIESKIRRLVKYYKREGVLPKDWKYDPEKAKLIVRR